MNAPVTEMKDATTLMIRRTYDADVETLFDALTGAEGITGWFGPGTFKVTNCESDVRVGGKWFIEMLNAEGNTHNVGGEYVAVDAPNSVVFTWAWKWEPDEVSQVTYRLSPAEDGKTTLTLIHERLPSENSRDLHGQGWNGALDNLGPWLAP